MSEKEEIENSDHPCKSVNLYGHEEEEAVFVKSFNSGKFPHAWLICGQKGIGKATFAYRAARFLLSQGEAEPASSGEPDLFGTLPTTTASNPEILDSMQFSESSNVFIKVRENTHLDLLVLSPEEGEKEILVDKVREVGHFMGHTAAESKWRVVIVDTADSMNRNSSNALLKILEEPPANTALLLICNQLQNILPTIRSRCRMMRLKNLSPENIRKILIEKSATDIDNKFYNIISAGSAGLYLKFQKINAEENYLKLLEILSNVFSTADVIEIQTLFNKENEYFFFELLKLAISRATLNAYGINQPDIVDNEREMLSKISAKLGVTRLTEIWELVISSAEAQNALHLDSAAISINIASQFA